MVFVSEVIPMWIKVGIAGSVVWTFLLYLISYEGMNLVEGFYFEVKNHINKLVNQGYLLSKMKYHLAKYFNKHFLDFTFKYWSKIEISRCY